MIDATFQFAMLSGFAAGLRGVESSLPWLSPAVLLMTIVGPLAFALALGASGKLSDAAVRFTSLVGFLVPAVGALWLWAVYGATIEDGSYAFMIDAPTGLQAVGISLLLGLNGLSLPLFVMAGLVGLAAALYTLHRGYERLRLMMVLLLIMQGGLMGVFASIDLFFFYFFHEFALIPTFIMVAIWGRQGRKVIALELTIYLTLGAMLTLGGLIFLYVTSGASAFNMIALREAIGTGASAHVIFGLLLIGFGILVSLFPFHTWAPRAYATAPTPAAMLHAGVLKKFGLYGLIQIAYPLLPASAVHFGPLLLWLALGNIVLIGLITLTQRDVKYMLGYASVMHMGYAFLGLYAASTVGIGGVILMLMAHGLSVGLLFLLADVIEKETGTAEMEEIGGLGAKAPILMGFFVAAMMASIGLPGFANFWGELTIFVALWESASPWVLVPALSGIVISAIYGLRAVANIFFGQPGEAAQQAGDLRGMAKLGAIILLGALLLVGFWPRSVSEALNTHLEANWPAMPVAPEQATTPAP